jgi:hypothetical protein
MVDSGSTPTTTSDRKPSPVVLFRAWVSSNSFLCLSVCICQHSLHPTKTDNGKTISLPLPMERVQHNASVLRKCHCRCCEATPQFVTKCCPSTAHTLAQGAFSHSATKSLSLLAVSTAHTSLPFYNQLQFCHLSSKTVVTGETRWKT